MTAIPDTGTWYNGPLNTDSQQYDVLVAARGNVSTPKIQTRDASIATMADTNGTLDLVVTPYETPDFFTAKQGKIVVAEPSPMGTVAMPKGYSERVEIELKTINGKNETTMTNIEKHVCLGIRIQGASEYLDVLRMGHTSMKTKLSDTEKLELIPLLSKSSSGYSAIEPGTEYPPLDSDYKPSGQFNFGSVFRVSIAVGEESWIHQSTDLSDGNWDNYGHLGVGPVTTQSGEKYDDQLLAVRRDGQLARSPDGIHWFQDMGKVSNDVTSGWQVGPVYGNGIWYVVNTGAYPRRSTDGGKNWSDVETGSPAGCDQINITFDGRAFCVYTLDGVFGVFSTSQNTESWEVQSMTVQKAVHAIFHEDGRYVLIGVDVSYLVGMNFETITTDLPSGLTLYGGCYANGYFYVINSSDGTIFRSANLENWEKVKTCGEAAYNVTYYKNGLYVISASGVCYCCV